MTKSWRLGYEKLFGRLYKRRPNRTAFQEFSRSLALIVDGEALDASVGARIRELFDPDRLIVLKADIASAGFQPSFSFGLTKPVMEGVQLAARGKLARWLSANETCLVLDRNPGVQEYLEAAERELLERLRVTTCVPMISLNRLTGMFLLGWDRPGGAPDRRQIELLNLLASQASLAFENAALYRAEHERLDRLHRAERLAAIGQLAAGVAHEIRNPLTAIRSTMQYLLRGLDADRPTHQLVTELLNEVDRINSTVGDLLSLSHTGERPLTQVDLRTTLAGVVQLLRAQSTQQQVELECELAAGTPLVTGDAGRLKQVFLNLMLNALQSMPNGGHLRVALAPWQPRETTAGRRAWVEVSIEDTGEGIPDEQLRKVFDPFYTTKRDGTGLGLAICHSIIEQHAGEIELQGRSGAGTRAAVHLPLVEGSSWRTS